MSIEPIGVATLLLGVLCFLLGPGAAAIGLLLMSLFGSAAAIIIGAANIQPAHLFLPFLVLAIAVHKDSLAAFLRELHPARPGFWFFCLLTYGIASAFLYPRLMAGITEIVPLGQSEFDSTGFTVPLGPVSSNFTQSIYMVANALCVLCFGAIASTEKGMRTCVDGMIAFSIGLIVFALVDLATHATGTQALLDFMRNAQYVLHVDAEVAGLKRIVGSFTEASVFARMGLGALAFTGTLWLSGYQPALTGTIAGAVLVLLVLSTSSTALAITPLVLALLYLTAFRRCGVRQGTQISSTFAVFFPLLVAFVALAVALHPYLRALVVDYFDVLVLSKSGTDSGIERNSWNMVGLQNFADSFGMGIGLGTNRTSSFPVALISSVGVPGTLFFLIFLALVFFGAWRRPRSVHSDIRSAARNGCIGLLLGDLLIGSTIDVGLLFCALAALAAAVPEAAPAHAMPRAAAGPAFGAKGAA